MVPPDGKIQSAHCEIKAPTVSHKECPQMPTSARPIAQCEKYGALQAEVNMPTVQRYMLTAPSNCPTQKVRSVQAGVDEEEEVGRVKE